MTATSTWTGEYLLPPDSEAQPRLWEAEEDLKVLGGQVLLSAAQTEEAHDDR